MRAFQRQIAGKPGAAGRVPATAVLPVEWLPTSKIRRFLTMNAKHFTGVAIIVTAIVLTVGVGALAQDSPPPPPKHFSGTINDYTPQTCPTQQTTPCTSVKGPWEMRGTWSLNLDHDSKHDPSTADFSAEINMTHDDYWVLIQPSPSTTVNDDSATPGRHPHTHHITITNGTVTSISTAAPEEFTVTGPVKVTLDGGDTPFSSACEFTPPAPAPCTLTVDIKGGTPDPALPTFTVVPFSNITMTFSGPPTGHFGTQAIHGVVRKATSERHDDSHRDAH
ncbi:MAG: hypothetical protein WAM91_13600 [Candidatus Acidiferrales bacterium]